MYYSYFITFQVYGYDRYNCKLISNTNGVVYGWP